MLKEAAQVPDAPSADLEGRLDLARGESLLRLMGQMPKTNMSISNYSRTATLSWVTTSQMSRHVKEGSALDKEDQWDDLA